MASATQSLETYAEGFSRLATDAAGRELPWLRKLRQEGYERFNAVGFPTLRDEDWRFTNLAPIVQTPFRLAQNGNALPARKQIEAFFMAGAACTLVFVDGRYAAGLSVLGKLPR